MESVSSWRKNDKVRVLVAGNSRMQTQLLSDALKRDPGLQVVNWNWNASTLIPTVVTEQVDVIAISSILDGNPTQGLEVVRELRNTNPSTKAVVLLDSQEDQAVVHALRAGARGIFSRESSVDRGEIWVDSRGITLAIEALASAPVVRPVSADGLSLLSKRELEVVQCLVQGLTNREIAERIGLSQHTVKNYLFRIFDKLGVSSRVELLFLALSQTANGADAATPQIPENLLEGGLTDETTLAALKSKAENGSPAAQLALAQSYLVRRSQPDDLVQAYTWFLIATEKTSQARSLVTRMLTAKQIDDAQQRASEWLARMQQNSPPAPAISGNGNGARDQTTAKAARAHETLKRA
jgi:two-component system, NarL family, nitrate/nitrite response regulator NarL